jgi:ATP/maltotriose-dependent transcriptional regulator MalT
MTGSLEEKASLLAHAWELKARRDVTGLLALLSPLPEEDLLAEPDLGVLLAFAWHCERNVLPALELVGKLAAHCSRRGNDNVDRLRLNLQGVSLSLIGKLDDAERAYSKALAASYEAQDYRMTAIVTMNLGIIADIRCEWERALVAFRRAVVEFQRIGDQANLAMAHHNLAMTNFQMGLLESADSNFLTALEHYDRFGTTAERMGTLIERAHLRLRMKDDAFAEASIRHVLSEVRSLNSAFMEGEAYRVAGIILHAQGQQNEARRYLVLSSQLAQQINRRILLAEVAEELAKLEIGAGNMPQAQKRADECISHYLEMGAVNRAQRFAAEFNLL